MIGAVITLYLLFCVLATLKLSYDVYERTYFTVPFFDCVKKVVLEIESYDLILKPWRVF